jgi:hypothetical protein
MNLRATASITGQDTIGGQSHAVCQSVTERST